MINMQGAPSPHVADGVTEEDVLESFYEIAGLLRGGPGPRPGDAGGRRVPAIPPGGTARQVLAEQMREQLAATSHQDLSQTADTELLDAINYLLFPNFNPCGGAQAQHHLPVPARTASTPTRCIAEIIFCRARSSPARRCRRRPSPLAAPEEMLFADITELGLLGPVFDQDCYNLPYVQQGLKTTRKPGITLANYQESRIRHFNRMLDQAG